MNLYIISNIKGCLWAGSEMLWHLSAMRALHEGHRVTAIVHSDLMPSEQMFEFKKSGGKVKNWRSLPISRIQTLKEKIDPSFPHREMSNFDVILVSLGSLPSLAYVPGLVDGLLRTKSPVILLCQFNSDHLIISPGEREVVRRVMARSAACVFVSQRNLTEARRQFAMPPPNAYVLQNPIRNLAETPCPWPNDSSTASFASVARLEVAWKGQDLLLDVLSQPQWRERDWLLNFYGVGPDLGYLRELVDFYQLGVRVSFRGFVRDLKNIWESNHLLVMSSHGEGTSLAVLESMMYGRPVVATDVGGNSEIITEGVTGFLAAGATLSSVSSAMERAWETRDCWGGMGQAARRKALSFASVDPARELMKLCVEISVGVARRGAS